MKRIGILLLMFIIACISYNCSSDDGNETPIPNPDTDPVANPNPNKTTTYTADVKTIIDTQCIECHGSTPTQGAPMALSTYAEIIDAINRQGRDVVGRMDTTGRQVMPPAGRLPQETVDIMLDWRADGYKE